MLVLGFAFLAWHEFGPVNLGGDASYVVTDGTSMLPKFRANGLVITRREPSYRVGEVAAYHNQQLKTVVMHRIVAIVDDRYVFKGDNNNFQDSYHATKANIVGKEWVYLPGAGRVLTFLRTPIAFAVIIGILGMFAASAYAPRSRRRRRHHARG